MRREGARRVRRALSAPSPRAIVSAMRRYSERSRLPSDRRSLLLNVDFCEDEEYSDSHHIQVESDTLFYSQDEGVRL